MQCIMNETDERNVARKENETSKSLPHNLHFNSIRFDVRIGREIKSRKTTETTKTKYESLRINFEPYQIVPLYAEMQLFVLAGIYFVSHDYSNAITHFCVTTVQSTNFACNGFKCRFIGRIGRNQEFILINSYNWKDMYITGNWKLMTILYSASKWPEFFSLKICKHFHALAIIPPCYIASICLDKSSVCSIKQVHLIVAVFTRSH